MSYEKINSDLVDYPPAGVERANRFIDLLKDEKYLDTLEMLANIYANNLYERVKQLFQYRLDDNLSIIGLLAEQSGKAEVAALLKKLDAYEDLQRYANSLRDFLKIRDSLDYFRIKSPDLKNPLLDYLKLAVLERQCLALQNLINRMGIKYQPEERKSQTFESVPNFDEKKLIVQRVESYEPDIIEKVRLQEPSLRNRVVNYIAQHPGKIILGFVFGAAIGCTAFFLWPVVGLAAAIGLTVGLGLLGGFIGASLVGLFHSTFGSKDQKPFDKLESTSPAPIEIIKQPIVEADVSNNPAIEESPRETTEKQHLLNFANVIKYTVPRSILFNLSPSEIVQLLKRFLSGLKLENSFELVKNSIQTDALNIDIINHAFDKYLGPLNKRGISNFDEIKFHFYAIQSQTFLQLFHKGEIDYSQIVQLTPTEFQKKEQRVIQLAQDVAVLYFKKLETDKAEYEKFFEYTWFKKERKRIRNVMIFFINSLNIKFCNPKKLNDEALLETFVNTINLMEVETVHALYTGLLSHASLYNTEFFLQFIQESKDIHNPHMISKLMSAQDQNNLGNSQVVTLSEGTSPNSHLPIEEPHVQIVTATF